MQKLSLSLLLAVGRFSFRGTDEVAERDHPMAQERITYWPVQRRRRQQQTTTTKKTPINSPLSLLVGRVKSYPPNMWFPYIAKYCLLIIKKADRGVEEK